MKIEIILKYLLGIILISFFITAGQELRGDNFYINVL